VYGVQGALYGVQGALKCTALHPFFKVGRKKSLPKFLDLIQSVRFYGYFRVINGLAWFEL
jgi:hypothetical protein